MGAVLTTHASTLRQISLAKDPLSGLRCSGQPVRGSAVMAAPSSSPQPLRHRRPYTTSGNEPGLIGHRSRTLAEPPTLLTTTTGRRHSRRHPSGPVIYFDTSALLDRIYTQNNYTAINAVIASAVADDIAVVSSRLIHLKCRPAQIREQSLSLGADPPRTRRPRPPPPDRAATRHTSEHSTSYTSPPALSSTPACAHL